MPPYLLVLLTVAGSGQTAAPQAADTAIGRLVQAAIVRRQQAFADSTLRSYAAQAHGVITFRGEIGTDVDRSVRPLKLDQVAVEVYWERPDRSKQIVRAWRDTTLFPTDQQYHRDHLGIVTDDLGALIRFGDGDEVRDVVHPLSPGGPALYRYQLADTLVVSGGGSRIVLVGLAVAPNNPALPGVVGTIYLDRDQLQIVRSQLTFTPSAYLDPSLEDITVRLERSLIEGRYWLPFRQQIEIRRRAAVVLLPLRGVIQADWQLEEYRLNPDLRDVPWQGPAVGGQVRPGAGGSWPESLTRVVDSALAFSSAGGLDAVRATARRLAKAQALDGLPRLGLAVSRLSEVFRFNRVEGLAVGAGGRWHLGGLEVTAGGAVATSGGRVSGGLSVRRQVGNIHWSVAVSRTLADAGGFQAVSGVVNSLTAQEWGRDLGDYLWLGRVALSGQVDRGLGGSLRWSLAREWPRSAAVVARPARGEFRANPVLGDLAQWTGSVGLTAARLRGGSEWRAQVVGEVGVRRDAYGRLLAAANGQLPVWAGTVGLRAGLGLGTRHLPAWRSFAIGGVGTVLGEAFRVSGGRRAFWASADWLFPVRGMSFPVGSGQAGRAQVGPLIAFGGTGGQLPAGPWLGSGRLPVTAGLAVEWLDGALRFEIGRRLVGPGPIRVSLDVNKGWWPIL